MRFDQGIFWMESGGEAIGIRRFTFAVTLFDLFRGASANARLPPQACVTPQAWQSWIVNVPLICLAMVRYNSFWDWITSPTGVKGCLLLAALTAFVAVIVWTVCLPNPKHLLRSKRLLLAAVPVIACSASAAVELYRLDWDQAQARPELIFILLLGVLMSAIATAIHFLKSPSDFRLIAPSRSRN